MTGMDWLIIAVIVASFLLAWWVAGWITRKTRKPELARERAGIMGTCRHFDSPLGVQQRCQLMAGHAGPHDYGNAAIRPRKTQKP